MRAALLAAAWSIVAEEGGAALTLRACARRAGVSHAAPEHHFGSLAGLIEECAADGYERMAVEMDAARADSGNRPLLAAGLGYVRFAARYPEHFKIMSTTDATSARSARLRAASRAVRARLDDALRDAFRTLHGGEPPAEELAARAALAWCCVHGYAMLHASGHAGSGNLPDAATVLALLRPSLLGEGPR